MMDPAIQKRVTFAHPFSLEGVEGTYPPGTYEVTETRERVEGLSFIGYRRIKTTIELPGINLAHISRHVVEVDGADIEAALERDSVASGP